MRSDDFMYELDRLHRAFRRTLVHGEKILNTIEKALPGWLQGPRAEVIDLGEQVKLIIEAPGLDKQSRFKWAYKTMRDHLILRGQLHVEQTLHTNQGRYYSERQSSDFLKWIPLPATVKRKPLSIRYRKGLLEILLEKQSGPPDERWYELNLQ